MTHPFVITGCGRSGTMGMARLLNNLGVRTSFEEYFHASVDVTGGQLAFDEWLSRTGTAGEVSGLAPPLLGSADIAGVLVIHQVRNPVAVIASLMGLKTWTDKRMWPNVKFNFRHLPRLDWQADPLTLSMIYWIEWNKMIEQAGPKLCYRVETMPGPLVKLLPLIGAPHGSAVLTKAGRLYSARANHRERDPSVSWRRLPAGALKNELAEQAIRYGYTENDLATYCPLGDECPHCGGS